MILQPGTYQWDIQNDRDTLAMTPAFGNRGNTSTYCSSSLQEPYKIAVLFDSQAASVSLKSQHKVNIAALAYLALSRKIEATAHWDKM